MLLAANDATARCDEVLAVPGSSTTLLPCFAVLQGRAAAQLPCFVLPWAG